MLSSEVVTLVHKGILIQRLHSAVTDLDAFSPSPFGRRTDAVTHCHVSYW